MDEVAPPTVAIIGRSGVGKTTQARRVAARLGAEVLGAARFDTWAAGRETAVGEGAGGTVLDGVPSCPQQALAMCDAGVGLDAVILLVVPAGVVGRRSPDGLGMARRRVDDRADVRAVAEWYCSRGKLVVVDGVGSSDSVTERILRVVRHPVVEETVIDLRDGAAGSGPSGRSEASGVAP